jgi:hypothetical protein
VTHETPCRRQTIRSERTLLAERAIKHRLLRNIRDQGQCGGGRFHEPSAGHERPHSARRYYIDKILKGTKPADLPVKSSAGISF